MSRRLVAAVAVLVLLALVPAGALSGVFASDTSGSGLVIAAADGPNGEYAELVNDQVELDFSGGVSDNAINRFDAVFTITNDRSYEAPVWIEDTTDAISFYDTETGGSVEGRDNGVSLAPGETLVVGVSVDTREANVSSVESTDNFSVNTLVEEATVTPTSSTTTSTKTSSTDSQSSTSGGSTSGGNTGGGQTGGGASESSYQVYDTAEGATVKVREGVPSDSIDADLTQDGTAYASGSGTTVDDVAMTLTFERNRWRVEVSTPTDSPQNAPAVSTGEAVSYTRLDAYGVEAAAFDSIAVNLTVSELPEGTDPDDVTVYRHTDDGWQKVETTHLGGGQYRANVGGFGELAVVVESDSGTGGTTGTDGTSTDDGTGGGTAGTPTPTPTNGTETRTSAPEPGDTATATDSERVEQPLQLDSGLGPSTLFVFGAFSVWLAVRARSGGGGGL